MPPLYYSKKQTNISLIIYPESLLSAISHQITVKQEVAAFTLTKTVCQTE